MEEIAVETHSAINKLAVDGPILVPERNASKPDKNPAAVALGRLGGLKGGKARAAKLSPQRRKKIAQEAARVRWGKDLIN